ncbi:nucleoside-diphosphate-sugar epimerase [Aeromicrobium sp. SORGH_AS981]|uniref:NAD-dependent epimerase/dehydratase family protein n=1 Tax=Aeromicrobium sp. SORGH_AS_0981 TaxID=3041802 RepID=UPI0028641C35|nr:NAD-dependent epimerase/dehydratase family protein [Aeromicrobium sp. SORGH_AS_0981]MDR6117914.1 nucleoside-diphosphate-sugar epimerase [Aeromicrobium sp. SORGH_AS_0981]
MSTLVIGAGQIGPHVATLLAERGEEVTVATRSGSGPEHPLVTRTRLDATDPSALDRAFADVDVVHLCVHASAYRPDAWERELPPLERAVLGAAERHGVHVVFPESVYAFDTSGVLGAAPRIAPRSAMGLVRASLLERRAASSARTTSVVASDFYGPGASLAHGGDRMVGPAVSGRTVRPLGRTDLPHAWTYLPDLAAAMVAAADAPDGPEVVLAPVVHASQRELALAYARAAGRDEVRVRAVPAWALRAVGVVSADVRALAEMSYLFTEPLLVDEGATILPGTPLVDAAAAVVDLTRRDVVAGR